MSDNLNKFYTFDQATGQFKSGRILNGAFIEDTTVLANEITQDLKQIFGIDEVNPSTPIGRFIEWQAINQANCMRINVQNAQQLLISSAAGQQLDVIGKWFGLNRMAATRTLVTCVVKGTAGVTLPTTMRARTASGDVYVLREEVTFDVNGEAVAVFECLEYGPIECKPNELTTIDTAYLGWLSVNNPNYGNSGRNVETDDAFRARIENSRHSGIGFVGAIKNALDAIDGVNSSMVIENNTGGELTVHGVDSMPPHSIFVCVDYDGQADTEQAIADEVLRTKPCGTGYATFSDNTNLVEVNGTDAYGNEYPVKFYKPELTTVNISLSVINRSYSGVNLETDIKNAILNWSEDKEFTIGQTIYAADIIKAVEERLPGVIVVSLNVNDGGVKVGTALSYLEIAAFAKPIFNFGNIFVSTKV